MPISQMMLPEFDTEMAVKHRNGNEEDSDPEGCLDECGFKIIGNDC